MKFAVILFACVATCLASPVKRAAGDQKPGVWDALVQNSGRNRLSGGEAYDLYVNAKAGQDYPILAVIPESKFDCGSVKPGFYADVDAKCQVVRRCDINGNQTSFLCPNMTLFNQITLVCDWFFDVDCSQAKKWYDYSNSRLYQGADVPLLDNQDQVAESIGASGRVLVPNKPAAKPAAKPAPAPKPAPAKPAPAPAKPAAKPTTAAPAEETTAAAEEATTAAAEETTAAAVEATTAAAEETTAAAAEATTAAAAEETTAAAAEETTAAAEETTAAAE